VGLFRRRQETLNEKLLREAGIDPEQALGVASAPPPSPLEPPKSVLATVGVPEGRVGPKEWDAVAAVSLPGLAGDRVEFTTLPNGDVIVGEEAGDADLSPLADAIEERLGPPYRAVGVRQPVDIWAVGAKRIEVARVPFPSGEKLELSRNADGDQELRVEDEASDAAIPRELEQLGEAVGDAFYVEASRIDGDLWEVRATAL
jgi:hypothetical protein